ncbi:hypothetical protein [Tenacibaculum sp. 190524A02b]|uniref:hypothetical protein n=1 Tax=Tenacibaculum vairaonense TaxID=3137860 RepID=UPI0031FA863F
MKKNILLALLFFLSFNIQSQEKYNEQNSVGFACYFLGQPTIPVKKIDRILKKKKYHKITNMLHSKINAEQYLAVISLEKLNKLGYYKLTLNTKKLISKIKNSAGLVYTCSGCLIGEPIQLKTLFNDIAYKNFNKHWLERIK